MRPVLKNPINVVIGKNIQQLRMAVGISQQQMATSIDRSITQMSKFECGIDRLAPEQLHTIAKTIGCNVADLFVGVDITPLPISDMDRADMAFVQQYKTLSDDMQSSVRSMVGAIVRETASKMRV